MLFGIALWKLWHLGNGRIFHDRKQVYFNDRYLFTEKIDHGNSNFFQSC